MKDMWDKHMESEIWKIACALDPHHKGLRGIDKKARDAVWDAVKAEMISIAKLKPKQAKPNPNPDRNASIDDDEEGLAQLSPPSEEDDLEEVNDNEQAAALELTRHRVMKFDGRVSCLEFWRMHCASFPRLARLAKLHLGVNAGSVASERVFSVCAHALRKRRNRLSARMLSALIFLNQCSKKEPLWAEIKRAHCSEA